MTHISATAFTVWGVLATALGAFLIGHLWRFDQFRCLRWSNSPYSGAFKRIMTYTYMITIPLIMIFAYGFAYIKYNEGFLDIGGTIIVRPYTFWRPEFRRAIFPLMLVFSFAWSFEMITHLEELCFWLFLINANPAHPDWFKSRYFRGWALGSVVAFFLVPTVTIAYRGDPLACEARTFTTGAIGDLVLTLGFLPILYTFPGFLRKVKAEGVDIAVMVRLRKFFELNIIRVFCRFIMVIPLLILGSDGLTPHPHVNESLFWTDFLLILAGVGCIFSSACTLLIFFPRSYEAEYQAKEASQAGGARSDVGVGSEAYRAAYDPDADMDGSSTFDARSLAHSATPLQKPIGSDGSDGVVKAEYDYAPKTFVLRANHKDDFVTPYSESEEKAHEYGRQQRLQMQNGLLRWASRGAGLRMSRSLKMHGRKFLRKHGGGDTSKSHHVELPARARTMHGHERQFVNEPNDADAASVRSAASGAGGHLYPQPGQPHDVHQLPNATEDIVYASARPSADTSRDGRDGADLERKGTYLLTDSPVRRNNFELPVHANVSEEERIANAVRVGAGASSTQALISDMGLGPGGGSEVVGEGGDVAEGNYAAYAAYADARSSVSAARYARGPGSIHNNGRGIQVPLPVQIGEGVDIDPLRATPSPFSTPGYLNALPPPPVPRSAMMPSDTERQYGPSPSSYAIGETSNGNGRPHSTVRGPRARRGSPEVTRYAEQTTGIENSAGTPSSAHAYQGSHVRYDYPVSNDGLETPAPDANTGVIIINMEEAETRRANGGPLTTANIFRHNHALANDSGSLMPVGGGRGEGRQSMLNPLVHTFTSPIDLIMGRRDNPAFGIGQAV